MTRNRILNIGIDLGTSRSVIACDNGTRTFVPSYVGYPKDAVSRKMFKNDIVFGDVALNNKMALHLYRPFDKGQLKYSDSIDKDKDVDKYNQSIKVAKDLLKHLVELGKEEEEEGNEYDDRIIVRGVIGAPALASQKNRKILLEIADGVLDDVMIATEPFCVAYGLGLFSNALIIDIGAGTVDLCRMSGTIPTEKDQITTLKAGDYVDKIFTDLILKQHEDANFTVNMVKKFKEDNSTVSGTVETVFIELPVNGKPTRYDVTDELRKACGAIVPDIVEGIKRLISSFDPEFQRGLKDNVILAGGGSQIVGLKKEIEEYMQTHLGYGRVIKAEEPLYAGANGALKLCKDMPDEYWQKVRSKEKSPKITAVG
jgi:rod shape-determining protein MreB